MPKKNKSQDYRTRFEILSEGLSVALEAKDSAQIAFWTCEGMDLARKQSRLILPLAEICKSPIYFFQAVAALVTRRPQLLGDVLVGKADHKLIELLKQQDALLHPLIIAADNLAQKSDALYTAHKVYRCAFGLYRALYQMKKDEKNLNRNASLTPFPKPDAGLGLRALKGMLASVPWLKANERFELYAFANNRIACLSHSPEVRDQIWLGMLDNIWSANLDKAEEIRIRREIASDTAQSRSELSEEAWISYERAVDALPLRARIAEYRRSQDEPGISTQVREKFCEFYRSASERDQTASRSFVAKFEPKPE